MSFKPYILQFSVILSIKLLFFQTLTLLNFIPLINIYLAISQHSAIFPYHPIPLFLPYSHILYSIILTIFRYFDLININIYILPIHILCYPIPVFLCIPQFSVYLHTYTQILMLHFSIYNLIFNFFYTYIFILTIDIYILIPIILHLLLPLTFLYLHSYIIQLHLHSHTSGLKLTLSQLQSYTLIIMPINIHLNFHFYILTIIC